MPGVIGRVEQARDFGFDIQGKGPCRFYTRYLGSTVPIKEAPECQCVYHVNTWASQNPTNPTEKSNKSLWKKPGRDHTGARGFRLGAYNVGGFLF